MHKVELTITGMTCSSCAQHVKHALEEVPGVGEAVIPGWRSGRAFITLEQEVPTATLIEAVREAGYRAAPLQERTPETPQTAPPRQTPEKPRRKRSGPQRTDLLVIGGGSAGFAAAIKAVELGRRATLVEAGTIGGTCVNVGCVPSKTLLAAMERYDHAADNPFAGVSTSAGRLAWAQLVAQKDALVRQLRQEKYLDVLDSYPMIDLVRGHARFEDEETVVVGEERYRPGVVLIATGARPAIPPLPGLDQVPYLDSTSALALRARPESLVIFGGGPVGTELGQLFAQAGSSVTIIQRSPTLLPVEEAELGEALAAEMEADGIRVETSATAQRVEPTTQGVRLVFVQNGEEHSIEAERLLVATGRKPNTEGLNLGAAGVEVDQRGAVIVDETLQTTNPRVFAAGDVTNAPQYVYVAAYAGGLAASNAITGDAAGFDLTALPQVTFTDPALASVGLTEEQARAAGYTVSTTTVPLKFVPRALANRNTRGLIKLVADDSSKKLLGAHVLAHNAGEMIQPAVLAIKFGLTIEQLTDTFFPYLTMVEGMKVALISFNKEVSALSCCAI